MGRTRVRVGGLVLVVVAGGLSQEWAWLNLSRPCTRLPNSETSLARRLPMCCHVGTAHVGASFEELSLVDREPQSSLLQRAASLGLAAVAGFLLAVSAAQPAHADKRLVGEIPASGMIFKDTINVEEFEDPKVSGVKLYLSDFSRNGLDRLKKGDFFSDPGAAGLTCTPSGPVKVAADLQPNKEGEDVFAESRSILFKTLKVKRLYDKEAKVVVYVVFTDRTFTDDDSNKSRFKSQLCAVPVDGVMEKK